MKSNPDDYSKDPEEIKKRLAYRINKIVAKYRPQNPILPNPDKTLPKKEEPVPDWKPIPVCPVFGGFRYHDINDKDSELNKRFFRKQLDDFLNDNIKPMPTIICEMERIEMIELIRRFILQSNRLHSFTAAQAEPQIDEKLGEKTVKDYGKLYIHININ